MAFPNKAARYDYLNKLKIQEEDSNQIPKVEKGMPNGVATLDDNGKVPLAQLPSSGGDGGTVDSVNGKVGEVVLNATDVGASPSNHTHTVDDITDLDLSTKANLTENTFTGVQTFGAGIVEKHSVATAGVVDLSLGNYFTTTITTDTTISVINEPVNGVKSFVLEVVNGGSAVVGYMDGAVWPNGEAPVLTVSGLDILVFYKIDSGGWRGFSAKDLK